MVHAGGADFHRQPDAGALAELVAVDAQPQPGGLAGQEHPAGLVLVEGALLAKDVGPADVGPDCGEHRPADQLRVFLRVHPGGHEVRPQVGHLVRHGGGDAGAAGLVLEVQAVAGFGLQVGGALRHGLRDAAHRQPGQVEVARAPGGAGGDGDPAGAVAFVPPSGPRTRPCGPPRRSGACGSRPSPAGAPGPRRPPVRPRPGRRPRGRARKSAPPRSPPPRRGGRGVPRPGSSVRRYW